MRFQVISVVSLVCMGIAFIGQGAVAQVTSQGCRFTKLNTKMGPAWGVVTRNGNKIIWALNALPLTYTNEGTDYGSTVISSPAVDACKKIGGDLPTMSDYFSLTDCFESVVNNPYVLSAKGLRDLYAIMPDMQGRNFWSSSVYSYNSKYAWTFSGVSGESYYGGFRYEYGSVRCVGR